MDGIRPARVADQIIDDLRKRERNGLIELSQRSELKPGDQVRILQGPFAGQLGLYAGISRAGAGVAGAARRTAACRAREGCDRGGPSRLEGVVPASGTAARALNCTGAGGDRLAPPRRYHGTSHPV